MQTDGNLVLYPASGPAVWSSGTAPSSNDNLSMQDDGNLVIYSGAGTALWVNGSLLGGGGNTADYPYADATDCSATYGIYSWCINGNEYSPYGYGYRNCTDYVAWVIQQQIGVTLPSNLGNGNTWGPNLKTDGYSYDATPQVGDIAAWNTGGDGFGHVAYVYAVNNGIASLDEYNVAGTGLFTSNRTTASGSAGAPSEFVHIGSVK
jgi:surface antigen